MDYCVIGAVGLGHIWNSGFHGYTGDPISARADVVSGIRLEK